MRDEQIFRFLIDHKEEGNELSGREKAIIRSSELDHIGERIDQKMNSYSHGLNSKSIEARFRQKERILNRIGGNESDWQNWKWQLRNVCADADAVRRLVNINDEQYELIKKARNAKLPFGITPLLSFPYGQWKWF